MVHKEQVGACCDFLEWVGRSSDSGSALPVPRHVLRVNLLFGQSQTVSTDASPIVVADQVRMKAGPVKSTVRPVS